ncbi:MAG: prenyltransferase [Thermoplasmatales archaeon]|nr:prenyltransferase [Thermoplasmatales archaeon]MCW6170740.1 prenyltransferase [Thermoplasmatales archaeon]
MKITGIIDSIVRGGPGIGIMVTYSLLAIFGYIFGYRSGGNFQITIIVLLAVSSIFTLGATNILDDYFDYSNGIDAIGDANSETRTHLIIHGYLSPRKTLILGLSLIGIPAAFMFYLIFVENRPFVLFYAIVSVFILIEYAGPPLKYRYHYFGELGVFASNVITISGSFYVSTGHLNIVPIIISLPLALVISPLAFLGNTRDINTDIKKGIHTISMRLGERKSDIVYGTLFLIGYILVFIDVAEKIFPFASLIVLLTFPFALWHIHKIITKGAPPNAEKIGGLVSMFFTAALIASIAV